MPSQHRASGVFWPNYEKPPPNKEHPALPRIAPPSQFNSPELNSVVIEKIQARNCHLCYFLFPCDSGPPKYKPLLTVQFNCPDPTSTSTTTLFSLKSQHHDEPRTCPDAVLSRQAWHRTRCDRHLLVAQDQHPRPPAVFRPPLGEVLHARALRPH